MTGGGSATPETITALLDAQGRALTKSFRRLGGQIVKGTYPNASEFTRGSRSKSTASHPWPQCSTPS